MRKCELGLYKEDEKSEKNNDDINEDFGCLSRTII